MVDSKDYIENKGDLSLVQKLWVKQFIFCANCVRFKDCNHLVHRMYRTERPVLTASDRTHVPWLPLHVKVIVCFCMRVRLWGYVWSLWKPLCPLLHANALTMALAFDAILGQPADQETGSNTGGGDLSDWSQTLFHLFSAMPAHTLMFHFPLAQGEGVSTKRAFWLNSLFRFCFNWFFPDRNTDQDKLSYALQFYKHPDSLMCERVNMCLFLHFPLKRFQSTE